MVSSLPPLSQLDGSCSASTGAVVVGLGRSTDQGGGLLRGSPPGSAQLPLGPSLAALSVESRWPS
eukprot:15452367-Alexandrium_andersonii.AAC.1